MAKCFGNTWWGEQWLRSLAHIDYGNRLPRGARYARNGSVKEINIKGGDISARVKGSRPSPYKVTVKVPQFDKKGAQQFIGKLLDSPTAIASLMQRRLDPMVLDIARECGLKVFPDRWSDFQMHCSCPDWAVPCKHLAAVIYKIAEEIDNDPFLVFSLHGIDLMKEMEKKGLRSDIAREMNPENISSLIETEGFSQNADEKFIVPDIDFSTIPSVRDELLRLLPSVPPFYGDGDFHKKYADALKSVARSVTKMLKDTAETSTLTYFPVDSNISFTFKTDFSVEAVITSPTEGTQKLKMNDFLLRLSAVSPDHYQEYEPCIETLHKMFLLAADLVVKGNVMPSIVAKKEDNYQIRWRPPQMQKNIERAVVSIRQSFPASALLYRKKSVINGGDWILSEMIGILMEWGSSRLIATDRIMEMFFCGMTCAFKGLGETGVPGGIKVWTDHLTAISGPFKPCFTVSETKEPGSFALSVEIDDGVGKLYTIREIMTQYADIPFGLKAISMLMSLSANIPGLAEYLRKNGQAPIVLSDEKFVSFLFSTIPLMRLLGLTVILPKALNEILKPKVTVQIGAASQGSDGKLRLDKLLNFQWQVALGEHRLSLGEFESLMITADKLIKFKGQYIYVNAADLEKLHKFFTKSPTLKSHELLAIALAGEYEGAGIEISKEAEEVIERLRACPEIPVPENLNATLRPYQERGFRWMLHNMSAGFGSIIADDMGLGKTLQVISVLLHMKNCGNLNNKALVVVPTGLLANWQSELKRFAPDLSSSIYHGTSRSKECLEADIVLSSYGVVRSDLAALKKHNWGVLVIDEAQNIKNAAAERTKALNAIPADNKIAMSGTPVENRLSEFWSIMNFVNKGYLGTQKAFASNYARPIQIEGNRNVAKQFRAVTAPFMMRRLKSDKAIISDLPDKIERNEYASLTPKQAALYQKTLNEAMRTIEGVEGKDHESLFKRQGLVLQMILALKQICDHPALFLKSGQTEAALSGKGEMLVDKVTSIVQAGEKVLIFTQFKEMGEILVKMLEETLGRAPLFYHGGCSIKQRTEMVERFQNIRADQVFVLSLKAAGTGLNLTAATNVIHYDLWWNPAVEAQATDRAYRIGQNRNVLVSRYITSGTFEERIDEMISEKKQLAELTVENGEKWITQMSNDQLRKLFSLSGDN